MISQPQRPFAAYGQFPIPAINTSTLMEIGQQTGTSAGAGTASSWFDLASGGLDAVSSIWSAQAGAQTARAQSLTAQAQAQALAYQSQAQLQQTAIAAQTEQAQIASRNQMIMVGGLLGLAAIAVLALRR